jgi:tetratricopeptide (TPR) repeat protein
MHTDRRGLALTAASADAAARYDAVMDGYLAFSRDTGTYLKEALAADPTLPMALCTRGYFFKLFCTPAFEARAAKSQKEAADAAEQRGATARERAHVAALAAWCAGEMEQAAARLEQILIDHPRDILAHKIAHFLYFYLGDAERMRDSIARTLHAWDERVPGHGYMLGMHAFGLEETGCYREAEAAGRRAVEINPGDAWAVHAVAHVMEMQGRHREGVAWTTSSEPAWQGCNNFVFHVWWHRALFLLELGQHDAVLDLYDRRIRAEPTEEYLDMVNAAALLWRLEDEGVDVGGRWTELGERAEKRKDDRLFAFVDAHFMMALAASGRTEAARAMLASMSSAAAGTEAAIFRDIGQPLCEALLAYRAGEHARVVDLLLPIRYGIRRLGGSHAQRDVFARMLIEAAIGAGWLALARALLAERTAQKPNSPWTWRSTARVLDGLGDGEAAARMRAMAASCIGAAA